MFSLASEGTDFLNSTAINYGYLIFIAALLTTYSILTSYLNKFEDKLYRCKLSIIISGISLIVILISHLGIVYSSNRISEDNFMKKLYTNSHDKYTNLGSTSNFINEIYKMTFFSKYNQLSNEEIEQYIYKETNTQSQYFGISKGNNLITILAESLEWFPFINDPSIYPNGANLSEEKINALYPNIMEFYNMSVVMNNHYSQNKTDISEDEALLGAYPNSSYINYGFPTNTLPTSIANTLKMIDPSIKSNFFHNNNSSFYNRQTVTKSLGYENTYFIEDMEKFGVTNYNNTLLSDSNNMSLDSEMIEAMKDKMFINDVRFNTHITTISTHGSYVYRENMQKWLDKMTSLNINIENDYLRNYMVSVMELDYALGLIMDNLRSKNLLDKTTIVIFSDHNTYMSNLSRYVKDIDGYNNELYRVPLMIYDPNIEHTIINKFTTTYDITPTIFDLFGINYFSNLYYGNSIFNDTESILYSKAFDIFLTDKIYFYNVNKILYKSPTVDDNYIKEIEIKSLKILEKIYHMNNIFYQNYFNSKNTYSRYLLEKTKIQDVHK